MSDTRHPRPSRNAPGFRTRLLAVITAKPGITIPDLAHELGCPQNRLYRELPKLHADGTIRKDGRHWFPAEDAR